MSALNTLSVTRIPQNRFYTTITINPDDYTQCNRDPATADGEVTPEEYVLLRTYVDEYGVALMLLGEIDGDGNLIGWGYMQKDTGDNDEPSAKWKEAMLATVEFELREYRNFLENKKLSTECVNWLLWRAMDVPMEVVRSLTRKLSHGTEMKIQGFEGKQSPEELKKYHGWFATTPNLPTECQRVYYELELMFLRRRPEDKLFVRMLGQNIELGILGDPMPTTSYPAYLPPPQYPTFEDHPTYNHRPARG